MWLYYIKLSLLSIISLSFILLNCTHWCHPPLLPPGQSKSLRLFFSDRDNTCGQLVIASRESQYKIFHFHHGGLDKLAAVFEDWNFLVKPRDEESPTGDVSLKQFLVCKWVFVSLFAGLWRDSVFLLFLSSSGAVFIFIYFNRLSFFFLCIWVKFWFRWNFVLFSCRPEVSESELHPEEGQHKCLDADAWVTYFNEVSLWSVEFIMQWHLQWGRRSTVAKWKMKGDE